MSNGKQEPAAAAPAKAASQTTAPADDRSHEPWDFHVRHATESEAHSCGTILQSVSRSEEIA